MRPGSVSDVITVSAAGTRALCHWSLLSHRSPRLESPSLRPHSTPLTSLLVDRSLPHVGVLSSGLQAAFSVWASFQCRAFSSGGETGPWARPGHLRGTPLGCLTSYSRGSLGWAFPNANLGRKAISLLVSKLKSPLWRQRLRHKAGWMCFAAEHAAWLSLRAEKGIEMKSGDWRDLLFWFGFLQNFTGYKLLSSKAKISLWS